MKQQKIETIKKGSCNKIYIPRGYCTIILVNQAKDDLVCSTEGKNAIIQNLSKDMKCQKVSK